MPCSMIQRNESLTLRIETLLHRPKHLSLVVENGGDSDALRYLSCIELIILRT